MSSLPVFQERYPHEEGFAALFAHEIAPLLQDMEQDRETTLIKFGVAVVGFVFAFAMAAFWLSPMLSSTSENVRDAYTGILTVIGMIGFGILFYLYNSYGKRLKGRIVPLIADFFGNLFYSAEAYLPFSKTGPFGILPGHTTYTGEDRLVRPTVFESSELKLTETRGSGKNRRTVTKFKGLALYFNLPRKVSARIIVKPDGGAIGNWLSGFLKDERVTLEDPLFEKLFEVYCRDQIESRRVLQPALMLRMVQFAELMANWGRDINELPDGSRPGELPDPDTLTASGVKFSASFLDDGLLMLVSCRKNLFQPGSLFTSAYDLNEIRCVLYQIHLIRLIADELKKFPQLVD